MNDDQFKGKWEQIKGKLRTEFGKLTDDDFEEIKGRKQNLLGRFRERYGDAVEGAQERLNAALKKLEESV